MTTGIGSGLGASFGHSIEGAWGSWLTPTKWTKFLAPETIKWNPSRVDGDGIENGSLVQADIQRQQTSSTVAGDVVMNGFIKGLGQHLGSLFGDLNVAPVQQAATTAYLQTHILSDTLGDSLAFQFGRPSLDGTINTYNYFGMKCVKAVFECGLDELVKCTFTYDGKGFDQVGAYGTPTYQAGNATFAFQMGTLKLGTFGAEAPISGCRKWILTIERPHNVKRFYLDGTGLKSEQKINGWTKIAVELETDYLTDAAFVAQFSADTGQSMIMDFTSPLLAGTAKPFFLKFAVPRLRWDDEPPTVASPEVLQTKMKLVGRNDGTNNPVSCTYQSTDITL